MSEQPNSDLNLNALNKLPTNIFSSSTLASADKKFMTYGGKPEEDLNLYLEEIQQYAAIHSLAERQASYLVRLTLNGTAKTWVRIIPEDTQYPNLLQLLLDRFQNQEKQIYYFRLLNKECQNNSDPSILNMLDRLHLTALKGNISEDFVVSLVLSSLNAEWESRISAAQIPGNPLSWTELYRICSIYKDIPTLSFFRVLRRYSELVAK
jgi:hypothetical protein